MESRFEICPLSAHELEELGSTQLILVPSPVYAPSIVKAYFLAHPWVFLTADKVAEGTKVDVKQVRVIVQRLVKEGWLTRTITKWSNKTHYYFFRDKTK